MFTNEPAGLLHLLINWTGHRSVCSPDRPMVRASIRPSVHLVRSYLVRKGPLVADRSTGWLAGWSVESVVRTLFYTLLLLH